jgi:sugar lactone lactonase YvrE
MKNILACIFLFTTILTTAQTHQLEKIWETDTVVAVPESVLADLKTGILYVSLINGGGWDVDGKGGVAKLNIDGKKYDSMWITGLNAPKGLGMFGNRIYAADISDVVVVDIKNGKIEKKIPIENATGLNDITVDSKGVVYVSDSRKARLWRVENDLPSLYIDSIRGVNGLKAIGEDLYIGAGKNFMKADKNKLLTKLADMPQGIDGIEPVGNGDFIVTSWAGYIFYVTPDGKVETLLDSHNEKMNTADIGFDPVKRIIYVPTFNARKIVAYSLK